MFTEDLSQVFTVTSFILAKNWNYSNGLQIMAYSYSEILFKSKAELVIYTGNMNESHKQYIEWKSWIQNNRQQVVLNSRKTKAISSDWNWITGLLTQEKQMRQLVIVITKRRKAILFRRKNNFYHDLGVHYMIYCNTGNVRGNDKYIFIHLYIKDITGGFSH